jgi:hypothetical protein
MNHRSLVFQLGALYTLLLSAVFVLVGAGTFFGLQHYLRANLRDSSPAVERNHLGGCSPSAPFGCSIGPQWAGGESTPAEVAAYAPGVTPM